MKKLLSVLSTIGISIAPVMGVVACGEELEPLLPISSDDVKSTIDNNGDMIIMKSKDYDFMNGASPVSTPAENEQNFTNWFSSQVDTIGGFSGTAVDTDYTVQILDNNTNMVDGVAVYQGWADSELSKEQITLKEVEITPVNGSQYLTGDPIKFYLIITPYLSFTGYMNYTLPTEDQQSAPITALNVDYDAKNDPIMDLTNVDSDQTFLDEFFKVFTHNLIGWDLNEVKSQTAPDPFYGDTVDWNALNNDDSLRLIIANKDNKTDRTWFTYTNFFNKSLINTIIDDIHVLKN
ncbi:hypothetical protein [Spiroplasma endosymbiont of Amphibalanus improvisus]|uniref:hypothetical protein n=1 Tax=Spiroplasma endosymbiont of Amphibalanus improvisus TaxID=3066327 RepID=UPI00313C00E1